MWPTAATSPAASKAVQQLPADGDIGGQRLLDEGMHTGLSQLETRPRGGPRSALRRRPRRGRMAISASTAVQHRAGRRRPRAGRRAGRTPPTSSTSGWPRSTRTWWRPIIPSPITPTRTMLTTRPPRRSASMLGVRQVRPDRKGQHFGTAARSVSGKVEVEVERRAVGGLAWGSTRAPGRRGPRAGAQGRHGRRSGPCTGGTTCTAPGASLGVTTALARPVAQQRSVGSPRSRELRQASKLHPPDRGSEVGHPQVVARNLVLVLAAPCPGCAGGAHVRRPHQRTRNTTMPPSPVVMFLVG